MEYTQKKYADAHEAVVTSQIYNKTLEVRALAAVQGLGCAGTGIVNQELSQVMSELMHRFQESSVYRSAASRCSDLTV